MIDAHHNVNIKVEIEITARAGVIIVLSGAVGKRLTQQAIILATVQDAMVVPMSDVRASDASGFQVLSSLLIVRACVCVCARYKV